MKTIFDPEDVYEYGFTIGFLDGEIAAMWIKKGKEVDHGDLLSSTDAYAEGYRKGLNSPMA